MRARPTARRVAGIAGAAALVLLLAACDDPPSTVKTTVSYDCQIKSNNGLVPDSTGTSTFGYAAIGPQAVAPGGEFDLHVVPDPFSFDGTPTSNGTVTQISNVVWRVAIPANSSLVSTSIADWSNIGPGTPTVAPSGSSVVVTTPGPIASSTSAHPNVARLPKVTLHLKATGALQSRINAKIVGTSYSSPGLTYVAKVTGTPIGTLNPSFSCFPSPSPILHSTLISNDTKAPVITIAKPVVGQSIVQGATVLADYSCNDGDGVGVASCVGTVADAAAIDTATTGAETFTVTSTDKEGKVATATAAYTVVAPG
jgi:dehydratase